MSGVSDLQQNGYEWVTFPTFTIFPSPFKCLMISLSASLTNLPSYSFTSFVKRPFASRGQTNDSPFLITPCAKHTL